MRVGSEGVGGVPCDAKGAPGAEAKAGADASAPGTAFVALLALLQGGAAEPTTEIAVGAADDVDGDDASAAVEEVTATAAAALADGQAQGIAGVLVTLTAGAAAQAAAAGTPDGAAHAAGGGSGRKIPTGLPYDAAGAQSGAATATPVANDGKGAAPSAVGAASARASMVTLLAGAQAAGGEQPSTGKAAARTTVQRPAQPAGSSPSTAAAVVDAAIGAPSAAAHEPGADARFDAARESSARTRVADAPVARPAAGADVEHDAGDEHVPDPNAKRPEITITKATTAIAELGRDAKPEILARGDGQPAHEGLGVTREVRAAGSAAQTPAPQTLRASLSSADAAGLPSWIERLTSPQHLAARGKTDAIRFDLEPSGLGRIEVRLSFGRDGLRAQVLAEHEGTRALLANQQPQLAAALERNDMRLESFLVDLGLGGDGGRSAGHDPSDVNAFDEIGLVHTSSGDEAAASAPAPSGLLSVRA